MSAKIVVTESAYEDLAAHIKRPAVFKPRLADLMRKTPAWAADEGYMCGECGPGCLGHWKVPADD